MLHHCIAPLFLETCAAVAEKNDLMIGNEWDSGYDCKSLYTYEIFIVACAGCGLCPRLLLRRAAAANHPQQSGEVSRHNRGIPAAATALQSERASSAHERAASRTAGNHASSDSSADKSREGRLPVWSSGPWQTAPGGESLFPWQIYRCRRIPSRNRGEGSLYRQDLSRAVAAGILNDLAGCADAGSYIPDAGLARFVFSIGQYLSILYRFLFIFYGVTGKTSAAN
jgi:hypothetical protein